MNKLSVHSEKGRDFTVEVSGDMAGQCQGRWYVMGRLGTITHDTN